ncbi:MAG TPA: hypothetical protein VNT51_02620, partial [Miltoncostaeaceae bacterium]|nr:hypothetical protein [Miltoncostaeaceae bacterium]
PQGLALDVTLAAPSRVGVDVLRLPPRGGPEAALERRPVASVLLDLPAGTSSTTLPRLAADRLRHGERYVLRVRTPARAAPALTAPVTLGP